MFDLAVDDDVGDAADETAKVLAEHERKTQEKKERIARQIAAHLGPHASTADQSYVSRLAQLAGKKKVKKVGKGGKKNKNRAGNEDGTDDMDISQTNNQQPTTTPTTSSISRGGRSEKFKSERRI